MKNGEGKFLYLDRGQVYTGTWLDDIAKCGVLEDANREGATNPPLYPIPKVSDDSDISFYQWSPCSHMGKVPIHTSSLQCTLESPDTVLQDAKDSLND